MITVQNDSVIRKTKFFGWVEYLVRVNKLPSGYNLEPVA